MANNTITPEDISGAIAELTTKWGYRNISTLIATWEATNWHSEDAIFYVCILQTPQGGPVYCKTVNRLLQELETAQARNEPHTQCPAPDPAQHMWMVVGNFNVDED